VVTPAASGRRVAFAVGTLIVARLHCQWALPRYPLPKVLELLTPSRSGLQLEPAELALAVRVSESLCARLRLPNTCLYRALSRWVLLRSLGRRAQFVVALDSELGGDQAHAWVEDEGKAFLENVHPRHVVMYRHPSDD
jgi:hypothetical protein